MIEPYKEHVLVKPDPTHKIGQTKEGIFFMDSYQKRHDMTINLSWGTITKVGEVEDKEFKVGRACAYNPFDAYEVVDNNETYCVVPTVAVKAIVV